MLKKINSKILVSLIIFSLLAFGFFDNTVNGLLSQNSTSWSNVGDTNSYSIAVGDVNADGVNEVISAGYFSDGSNWNGQLVVLNSGTLATIATTTWRLGIDTNVAAVAIGDVDGDGAIEIVTAGSFFNGNAWIGQLIVWNGATLAVERINNWLLGQSNTVSSLAIANVSGGRGLEIVTGANVFDGVNNVAQLIVWNGTNLVGERLIQWRLGIDAYVTSVAIANVSLGSGLEIVTGGYIFDGTNNIGQLIVWNGTSLTGERLVHWRLGTDTYVTSVAIADVSVGAGFEIVSGGYIFDGVGNTAQVIIWNGADLATVGLTHFRLGQTNIINSIAIGAVSSPTILDIVTYGTFNDGGRYYGQVVDLNSATLAGNSIATWYTTSDTGVYGGAIGNVVGFGNRIFAGGQYFDTVRSVAQITVWS
jgi:hypothetical protein